MFELFKHMLNTSIAIYRDEDYAQYSALMEDENYMDLLEYKARQKHFDRMARNECATAVGGSVYCDILETWNVWPTIAATSPAVQSKPPQARKRRCSSITDPVYKTNKRSCLDRIAPENQLLFFIPFQFLFIIARPLRSCASYNKPIMNTGQSVPSAIQLRRRVQSPPRSSRTDETDRYTGNSCSNSRLPPAAG